MEIRVTISPQVELVGINKPFRLFLCLETVSIKFNSFKIQKKTTSESLHNLRYGNHHHCS